MVYPVGSFCKDVSRCTVNKILILYLTISLRGISNTIRNTRWIGWFRYCAVRRKVAGLVSDGVFGTSHWHNPSVRTMDLGSNRPLTEMSTWIIFWEGGKGGRCVGLTTLPPSYSNRLEILGASTSWISLLFLLVLGYVRERESVCVCVCVCATVLLDQSTVTSVSMPDF
jgi:hypothetical protein